MASKYQLTYLRREKRWRKRYQGKSHYFPLLPGETKDSSYRRVLDDWEKAKAEVDRQQYRSSEDFIRLNNTLDFALQQRDQARANRHPDIWRRWNEWVLFLERNLAAKIPISQLRLLEAGEWVSPALLETGQPVTLPARKKPWLDEPWNESMPTAKVAPTKGSIGALADEMVSQKRQAVDNGNLTAGRLDCLQRQVRVFVEWLGPNSAPLAINGKAMIDYREHVCGKTSSGQWSNETARGYWRGCRQFVQWLHDVEVIDRLPRNFRSLKIGGEIKAVETFDVAQIRQLLGAADERTELYLLLMLNVGATQQDVSDLSENQVDWRQGRDNAQAFKDGWMAERADRPIRVVAAHA